MSSFTFDGKNSDSLTTKVTKVPKYEQIQTGFEEKKVYVTSDGTEFENEYHAREYEIQFRTKARFDVSPNYAYSHLRFFDSKETFEMWLQYDKETNYDVAYEDYSNLSFPNWYIIVEVHEFDENDNDLGYNTLKILTIDEYIDSIKKAIREYTSN